MSDAETIERLRHIGWRGDTLPAAGLRLARVVAQHRAGYELHDGEHPVRRAAGRALPQARHRSRRSARWSAISSKSASGAPPHIVTVAPRRTVLSRAAAGERYERQLIATNIDYVLVLTGLDGDFNPARIERYLSLTEDSGAQPVVLLSKLDTRDDAAEQIAALRERLPDSDPDPRHQRQGPGQRGAAGAVSAAGRQRGAGGLVRCRQVHLDQHPAGQREAWPPAEVRSHDSRGRHTTTHRALLQLPTGGCLIDTPGHARAQAHRRGKPRPVRRHRGAGRAVPLRRLRPRQRARLCGAGGAGQRRSDARRAGATTSSCTTSARSRPPRWRRACAGSAVAARSSSPHGHRGQRERD